MQTTGVLSRVSTFIHLFNNAKHVNVALYLYESALNKDTRPTRNNIFNTKKVSECFSSTLLITINVENLLTSNVTKYFSGVYTKT